MSPLRILQVVLLTKGLSTPTLGRDVVRSESDEFAHISDKSASALATINATDSANVPQSESLERFLSSLPELWRKERFVLRTRRRRASV